MHGIIVNPACLKDLDCLSACPQGALHYTFTKPSLWKSLKSGGRFGRQPYDFSLGEEAIMASIFVFVVVSFRGLYGQIPFLLSLALAAIIGYLTVIAVRLTKQSNVRLATIELKERGDLTQMGRAYAIVAILLAILVIHSAFVRFHEYTGLRQAIAMNEGSNAEIRERLALSAMGHLKIADRWGLLRSERVERSLLAASVQLRRYEDTEAIAARLLAREPRDDAVRLRLGESLAGEGRFKEAAVELQTASRLNPSSGSARAALGSVLAELGQLDGAIAELREAVKIEPSLAQAHYNLGSIVARNGQFRESIPYYQQALAAGLNDADLHNNLGFALFQTGAREESREQFERAILLDAKNANAHFNLGNLLAAQGNVQGAAEHYRAAARVDPRFANLPTD